MGLDSIHLHLACEGPRQRLPAPLPWFVHVLSFIWNKASRLSSARQATYGWGIRYCVVAAVAVTEAGYYLPAD